MKSVGKYLIIFLAAVLLALPLISSAPVSASPGLSVSPLVLKTSIAPGDSRTFTMTVGSGAGDPPMDIVVEVKGLGQSPDGRYQALALGEDKSPYSAQSFISISPQEFHLEQGASQEVEVVIAVPEDVGDGGRYAIIYTHIKPAAQSGTSIVSAIGTSLVLTISGTELIKTGSISDFTIAEIVSGEPLDIAAVLENTGNYHYKALAEAILKDGAGSELATASTSLTSSSIVPTCSREFKLSLTLGEGLSPGTYHIDLETRLKDGTVLDSQTESLEIGEAYVPSGSNNLAPTQSPTTNWALVIGGFTGGCILTGLLVYFLVARRRRWS